MAITPEKIDLGNGACIAHAKSFVQDHTRVMRELTSEISLGQRTIRMYGREVKIPRLTAWYGDPGVTYTYSKVRNAPQPWTPGLRRLRDQVSTSDGVDFNSVLVNLYRDGRDSVSAHADDEPELGPDPLDVRIASISLGAERLFRLRPNDGGDRRDLMLGGGSLLVMGGTTQRHWRHDVPKTRKTVGPRMNLTFRVVT